jgi:hypothetical protein
MICLFVLDSAIGVWVNALRNAQDPILQGPGSAVTSLGGSITNLTRTDCYMRHEIGLDGAIIYSASQPGSQAVRVFESRRPLRPILAYGSLTACS